MCDLVTWSSSTHARNSRNPCHSADVQESNRPEPRQRLLDLHCQLRASSAIWVTLTGGIRTIATTASWDTPTPTGGRCHSKLGIIFRPLGLHWHFGLRGMDMSLLRWTCHKKIGRDPVKFGNSMDNACKILALCDLIS